MDILLKSLSLTILGASTAVAVHELGHILFGLIAGSKLREIGVRSFFLPVEFKFDFAGISVAGKRTTLGMGYSKFESRAPWQNFLIIAGGPLLNLAFIAFLTIPNWTNALICAVLVYANLVMIILNLLPFKTKFFSSDSWNLWAIMNNLP